MERKCNGIDRSFCLFFFCESDDLCLEVKVKVTVDLTIRNRACEDCRNNFIALVKERLDHSAGRIIRLHVLENFFAADHIEIIRAGQDRIKRVGFVHQ